MATLQNCNVCHLDFPLTSEFWHRQPKSKSGLSGTCKGCARKRALQWRDDNLERHTTTARAYRAATPEKVAASKRLSHIANREKDNARTNAWIAANAERLREQHREYRAANRAAIKERKRLAHIANRESNRAKSRAWASANAERDRSNKAEYYRKNAEAIKRRVREYRTADPARTAERNRLGHLAHRAKRNAGARAWKAANPERVRAACIEYRSRRRNAPGRIRAQDVLTQYETQRGTCFYCPRSIAHGTFHADHFVPLSRGGSNEPSNIVLACPPCNMAKGSKPPSEFLALLLRHVGNPLPSHKGSFAERGTRRGSRVLVKKLNDDVSDLSRRNAR